MTGIGGPESASRLRPTDMPHNVPHSAAGDLKVRQVGAAYRSSTQLELTARSNYRYSTNHQVVIDADSRLVVAVGRPLPGNRHDSRAWAESGAKAAVGNTTTIADGGYPGTGLVMPHRRRPGEELPDWKQAHNKSHKQVRARVEHCFARMKTWKILRDCRLRGDGVHHAMLGIARLHNLALTG